MQVNAAHTKSNRTRAFLSLSTTHQAKSKPEDKGNMPSPNIQMRSYTFRPPQHSRDEFMIADRSDARWLRAGRNFLLKPF